MSVTVRSVSNGETVHSAATVLTQAVALMREVYPEGSRLIAFTLRVSQDAPISLWIPAQQGAHFYGFTVDTCSQQDGYMVLLYQRVRP